MGKEMGLKGGRRGRGRAALVMLWAEAGLPELRRWQIAGWKDVVGIVAVDPALGMITPGKCFSPWSQVLGISAALSFQFP